MKIAIFTLPLIDNFGGVLQNFAMQKSLRALGHDVYTLDTCYRYSLRKYISTTLILSIFQPLGIFKNWKKPLRPYKGYIREKHFGKFIEKNIKTIDVKSLSESIITDNSIDTIIVGSDQVWRPKYNKPDSCSNLYNAYLDFAEDINGLKRIAYAASFGVDSWEYSAEETHKCKQLLSKFNAVSVREKSGISLCSEYLKHTGTEWVPDPTLLLSAADYRQLFNNKSKTCEPYLLAYILDGNDEIYDILKGEAYKKGLKLNIVHTGEVSPSVWLELIDNATAVVTDSFHCTVFSLILHTPVYLKPSQSRGKARFYELFGLIEEDMERFCIRSYSDLPNLSKPDYDKIDNKLRQVRNVGTSFLLNNL